MGGEVEELLLHRFFEFGAFCVLLRLGFGFFLCLTLGLSSRLFLFTGLTLRFFTGEALGFRFRFCLFTGDSLCFFARLPLCFGSRRSFFAGDALRFFACLPLGFCSRLGFLAGLALFFLTAATLLRFEAEGLLVKLIQDRFVFRCRVVILVFRRSFYSRRFRWSIAFPSEGIAEVYIEICVDILTRRRVCGIFSIFFRSMLTILRYARICRSVIRAEIAFISRRCSACSEC